MPQRIKVPAAQTGGNGGDHDCRLRRAKSFHHPGCGLDQESPPAARGVYRLAFRPVVARSFSVVQESAHEGSRGVENTMRPAMFRKQQDAIESSDFSNSLGQRQPGKIGSQGFRD
jgi:hypothetical protein